MDTSSGLSAVNYGFQRKQFHAAGLFWAFYSDGTNAGWETSDDGVDWSGAFTSIGPAPGYDFSVFFDGTYIHYIRTSDYDTFYRRGIPQANGTINWSENEQLVYDGSFGDRYRYPTITVDSLGYAWIAVYWDDPGASPNDHPYVLKNANLDGTWSTDFAYELNAADSTSWKVAIVPLTDGKVYVIYCRDAERPLGKLYDAGWGAEENDLADYDIRLGYAFSAGAIGDDVQFIYNKVSPYQLRHNIRVYGVGWNASDVLVQTAMASNSAPALTVDPSENEVYAFWTRQPTDDHIFYKKYSSGSWGSLVDWFNESSDGIIADYLITSSYMDYDSYVGVLYVTKTGSPYNVRFAFLETPLPSVDPPTVTTQDATNIGVE